ncbi:hypothetical protein EST38_g6577 [Candolleomyces aberdarensis]|uniref:Nephrocystin 3-like N-terminal domain-containing protein n=1 Tax=Candolleomyces aberdarensis TaxID=2316362 RepID=A0A4Q2DHB4_9AGAR|nr:hypothetical protein EST38_g6577 [Candolleomyces aberdarensis]
MDPPGEQRSEPRKRDRIMTFLKDPFGCCTPSPLPSRTTSRPTVAGGQVIGPQAAHDVASPSLPAENTTRSEIQSNQDNIDTATGGQLRQDISSQAIQPAIPSLPAQNESTFIPSNSAFDHNGASQLSNPLSSSGRLASSGRDKEPQTTTGHVYHSSQALGTAVFEGDPSHLLVQSNNPAAATSHEADEPQEGPAHGEHQPAGLGSKIYEGVKTTLRRIVDVSEVFPPLKSTAAGLLAICNTIDGYGENHEEFAALLKRVEALSRIIDESPPNVHQRVQDRFSGLSRTLEEKKKILQDKVNPNRSIVDRAILTDQDKQEVLKLTQEIRFAIEIAMFDATIENMKQTLQVVSGVDWLKERIEIIEDHTGAVRNIEEAVRSLKRSNTFDKLGGVEGAEFSNPQRGSGCTPGSRISLLATLLVWAKDPRSPHLFWLSGLAGTGKTAVSKTFCSQLNDRGLLGASFFCTLSELNQKDVYLIIPTLARILAEARPNFGDALEKILESDGACRNPTKMDLKVQYAKLILQPAKETFAADGPLVLGVDALDECENKEAVKLFIEAILSQQPAVPLKFFLTSRPEVALRESFETSTQHGRLRLHDIEASIVKADILLYLNDRFKCIPRVYNHYQAKSNWPPPEVQVIADASGRLFIIAATMVAYIATYSGNSLKRFWELGKHSANVQLSGIETLYRTILAEAFTALEPEEADMIHSCLSLLVTAQRPVSVNDYAKLLSTHTLEIREAFKSLHSVVQVPDEGCDDALISIFHASFVDYLTSEKHSGEKWAVDKTAAHSTTAEVCFAVMDSMLCFGISGAKTSYQSNDNQGKPLKIASELAYACTSWGEHVLYAGVTEPFQQRMLEFVKTEKVLYWLEALSALKNVKYAYNMFWEISKAFYFYMTIPLLHLNWITMVGSKTLQATFYFGFHPIASMAFTVMAFVISLEISTPQKLSLPMQCIMVLTGSRISSNSSSNVSILAYNCCDIMYLEALGQPIVVLNSLSRATDLYDKRGATYSDRPYLPILDIMEMNWSFGLMPYGTKWCQHRRPFHQLVNSNALPKFYPVFSKEIIVLLWKLHKSPKDFLKHIQFFFGANIMYLSYGFDDVETNVSLIHNAKILMQAFSEAFSEAALPGRYLVNNLPFLKYVPAWFPGAGWKKKCRYIVSVNKRTLYDSFESVKESLRKGRRSAHPSMAVSLLDEMPEENTPEREELESIARISCAFGYAAGADTTVSSAAALFLVLATHPDVQKKAQAEID